MATQPTETAPPQKRRRWLPRIALRTLLVLVTVLAIGLAWLGNLWHRVQRQRQIVRQIEAAGGVAFHDYKFITHENLDYLLETHVSSERWVIEVPSNPNALVSRYHRDDKGRHVDTQVETPPGPWLLRWMLGIDACSYIEVVEFLESENEPRALDPRLLRELPRLKVVILNGKQVSDEWVEVIAHVPELRCLALYGSASGTVTERGLARLQEAKHLRSLSISGECVNDDVLRGVAELKQLRSLEIGESSNVTSTVFTYLDHLRDLEQLIILKAKNVDDRDTAHLKKLARLRTLWLSETSIGDDSMVQVAELKTLERLDLERTNVSDRSSEELASLTKLKRVDLGYTQVGDGTVQALIRLPHLRDLKLAGTGITNASSPALGSMTQLQWLELSQSSLTDEALIALATLQNLEVLHIGPTVSLSAANELRQRLPNCKVSRFNAQGLASYPDYDPPSPALRSP